MFHKKSFVKKKYICFTKGGLFQYRRMCCLDILTRLGVIYSVLLQIKAPKEITITTIKTTKIILIKYILLLDYEAT